jgi:hypothetical protein
VILRVLAAFAASIPAQAVQASPPSSAALVIVRPDAAGVATLPDDIPSPTVAVQPNPFIRRYFPPQPTRDITVLIEAVLIGGDPGRNSAVINGLPYAIGDRIEGLTISDIGSGGIELRCGRIAVLLPVEDRPNIVRLPRQIR